MKNKAVIFLLIFSLGIFPSPLRANQYLPADVSTAIILKALTYDRSLQERFQDTLTIGVLYTKSDKEESRYAKNFHASLESAAAQFAVGGLKVKSVLLEYSSSSDQQEELSRLLVENHVSVVVVLTDKKDLLGVISEVTRELKINSMCTTRECLEQGIAFGVLLEGNKPKMYVNLESVKREGSDYSGKLLSLCEKVN